jgi:hypothetical protein
MVVVPGFEELYVPVFGPVGEIFPMLTVQVTPLLKLPVPATVAVQLEVWVVLIVVGLQLTPILVTGPTDGDDVTVITVEELHTFV